MNYIERNFIKKRLHYTKKGLYREKTIRERDYIRRKYMERNYIGKNYIEGTTLHKRDTIQERTTL